LISREFVSLPLYPELTPAQIARVIEGVKTAVVTGVLA
jgi:dTDP-4-amino-4,6-dideoxygalactose transaminase